jgi:NAD(P)-dependent dehydrogenase (short-subunit alcohol dehydrogenase family)
MAALSCLYSQLFVTPPIPAHDFTGQTIIITGGNYEAARHILRLNAAPAILAVRSLSSGQAAKETLERDTRRCGAVDVYELDMASHASVQKFVMEMKTVDRIDAVLLNAGIFTQDLCSSMGMRVR